MLSFISYCEIGVGDIDHRRRVTRDRLEPLVRQVAARLWASGVRPGEVVLYQGSQQASALVLFWACMLNGAIFAAADEGWPAFQLATALQGIAPRLVASTSRSVAAATTVYPDVEHLWLEPEADMSDLDGLASWSAGAAAQEPANVPDASPAAYLFTSGTSGAPKAVVHSRQGLGAGGRLTVRAFNWQVGERLINLPDPHTMSGLRNAFLAAPLGGIEWIPFPDRDRPNIFALLDGLERAQCDRLVVGPLFLRQLAMLGDRAPAGAFSTVKAIYSTGATLDPESAAEVHARLGIPIINYYGLTETGGICLSQNLDGWQPGDRTLGYPAGCETRIVDRDGNPVANGEEGELLIRSPQLMIGYLDDPIATADRLDRGWLRTGDLVRRMRDGRYMLVGRASQFIKTISTERVHPEEIERVLERHAAVAEAAVFGRPEAGGGERIAALIVTRQSRPQADSLPNELADFVSDLLGPARRPAVVRFVDKLPRLGNGKLIRHQLQDL